MKKLGMFLQKVGIFLFTIKVSSIQDLRRKKYELQQNHGNPKQDMQILARHKNSLRI